ncbi:MAG TPA: DUF3857 domain-containing protein [Candidatus Acidoferrum sp.]|nr:DUF3857 domain-containing protein [Candidatus Acidoferrum sp.]
MQSDAAPARTSSAAKIRRVAAATVLHERLYHPARSFYTALVTARKPLFKLPRLLLYTAAACFLFVEGWRSATAQETQQKPASESAAKSDEKADRPEKAAHPAQIELLETKVRFETNGDSRKEVHALVKINSELGVSQFAQLNFDFNRTFESVEIPMVHITHATGGTADMLPSAITDHPNPAVLNFPAYQDVRVKSVRILGLQPGDTLEYRVVRTVSHDPLSPDFWLEHSFDRTGVVAHEIFELDLPASRKIQKYINPNTPETLTEKTGEGDSELLKFRWQRANQSEGAAEVTASEPDVVLTTYDSWSEFAGRVAQLLKAKKPTGSEVYAKAWAIVRDRDPNASSDYNPKPKIDALYDFVSQKIRTVDLPLGATGFRTRPPADILASGYATPEDKFLLFAALASEVVTLPRAVLVSKALPKEAGGLARPNVFDHLLTEVGILSVSWWVDLSLEVAPFGMIPSQFIGKPGLVIEADNINLWPKIAPELSSFPGLQRVSVDATFAPDGKLSAKVHYTIRGDNELVLREAFHNTPKERWKEVAQLLSITDGFRGQVTSVNASDPYATKEPFTVEYELDQPKFVDWSKKPVRIPALLPQLGLPDPPAKPAAGSATAPIDLGTPLEVETKMTLHLPLGTNASAPAGTSVERDYATYASQYSVKGSTLTATRHVKFILREVPAARAADYNAFLRAVQSDESQDFTLEPPPSSVPKTNVPKTNSAAPSNATPPKPAAPTL